jgi:hypothetical protein
MATALSAMNLGAARAELPLAHAELPCALRLDTARTSMRFLKKTGSLATENTIRATVAVSLNGLDTSCDEYRVNNRWISLKILSTKQTYASPTEIVTQNLNSSLPKAMCSCTVRLTRT